MGEWSLETEEAEASALEEHAKIMAGPEDHKYKTKGILIRIKLTLRRITRAEKWCMCM